nr:endoplasmic reticulum aminopeptidase 2-like [Lytechinus pictus]XP_054775249.1 endoplasmic reticulum aminopeptidase 2-like [Lytechinus pictus]
MASTQFEPTSARQAFPCFDEPSMKANFSLKMVHDENHITLFNMPAQNKNEQYKGTLLLDTYQTTVPMSTYLVAFVVCDFISIEGVTSSGTHVAMYAPVDQISQANLALEVVNKTIPFYEEFFDIAYPLPKQGILFSLKGYSRLKIV